MTVRFCLSALSFFFTNSFPILAAKTAYLLFASDNNQNFKIAKMDANYYTLSSLTATIAGKAFIPDGCLLTAHLCPTADRVYA
jgi:hypothetical protein